MNSTYYMENLMLQPIKELSPERYSIGNFTIAIEVMAICFNLFTFYLVKKQGFLTLDIWIASFLSLGDTIFVAYKLSQLISFQILGIEKVFLNVEYGQYDGFIECYLILFSINCVGFLAVLRYWVLYLRKEINLVLWILTFIIAQLFIISMLIGVFMNKDFILMPFQRYYFPNTISVIPSTRATGIIIILFNFINLLFVNTCYPLLAKRFIHQLHINNSYDFNNSFYSLNTCVKKQKRNTVIKTCIMLVLYNLAMLPYLIVAIKEQIQLHLRSNFEDTIIAVTAMLLTVINPMMLMSLHDGISSDLKNCFVNLFNVFRRKNEKLSKPSKPSPYFPN